MRDLFAAIAHRYDLINDLQSFGLHRYWKGQLVRMAQVKSGERALDICCGTGDVALALAKYGGQVTGLDFSRQMLAIGKARAPKQRCRDSKRRENAESLDKTDHSIGSGMNFHRKSSIEFLQGDALRLPFGDEHFDVITISYGLRNLENLETALIEMRRVLKPSGRLLVLDFGKPDNAVWRKFYFAYLRCWVPWFGRLFCGNSEAYAYILESLERYPAQRGVASAMTKFHFTDVKILNFLCGVMSINLGRKAAP